MNRATVIGVGSPFGSDVIGWEAVAYLRQQTALGRGPVVEYQYADRPGSDLLRLLANRDVGIIVDAAKGGQPPGTVYRLLPHELNDSVRPFSSHGFGVAHSLALGEALNALPSHTVVYGIEAGDGPVLAERLKAAAFSDLADRLRQDLAWMAAESMSPMDTSPTALQQPAPVPPQTLE